MRYYKHINEQYFKVILSFIHNNLRKTYFCDKNDFTSEKNKERIEKLSLGLIRCTSNKWITCQTIKPLFEMQEALADLECKKFLHEPEDCRIYILLKNIHNKSLNAVNMIGNTL